MSWSIAVAFGGLVISTVWWPKNFEQQLAVDVEEEKKQKGGIGKKKKK